MRWDGYHRAVGFFSTLTEEWTREIANVFQLGEVSKVQAIEAGTINSNFHCHTARGEFFLRVNEGKTQDEVAYEGNLLAHLSPPVRTPKPIAARDGRLYAASAVGLVTVFPFVAGVHRKLSSLNPDDVELVGTRLAELHVAGQGFSLRRESRYTFARIVDRWRGLPAAETPEFQSARRDIGDEIAWLKAARRELPTGVIHGDLFPDNVLFSDEGATLLDFEQASDGPLAYDLAVCLCAWCFTDHFVPERMAALISGYERVRPLSPAERAGLWAEARFAAMRFTVTRMTDVFLNPRASELLRRTKDFRRYHERLRRLRAMGEDGFAKAVGNSLAG